MNKNKEDMQVFTNGSKVDKYKKLYRMSNIGGVISTVIITIMLYDTYLSNYGKTGDEILM